MEAQYCQRAKREFEDCVRDFDVDYVGGHCGIEVWQDILPTEEWLTQAVPLVWGHGYEGKHVIRWVELRTSQRPLTFPLAKR